MKLRDGMYVSGWIHDSFIERGILRRATNGAWYLCQNEIQGKEINDKGGFKYSWQFVEHPNGGYTDDVRDLRACHTTVDMVNLRVGSRIRCSLDGQVREVICICGKAVLLSSSENRYQPYEWYTIMLLKAQGYTVVPNALPEEKKSSETSKKYSKVFAISFVGYPDPDLSERTVKQAIKEYVWKIHSESNKGISRESDAWKALDFDVSCIEMQ